MRAIYINNTLADIDNKTAIGITYQALDFKQPGKRKVKVSNTFSIPATANNLAIIKNENNPQSTTKTIYDELRLSYYQDNEKLIDDSLVRVEGVDDRISLFVFQKDSFWEQMKTITFNDAMGEMWQWMSDNNYIYNLSNSASNYDDFILDLSTKTEYIVLPRYGGNLYEYDPDGTGSVETISKMALNYQDQKKQGGHFCIYWKSIFEFIEFKYDVTLFTDSEWSNLGGNIFFDEFFTKMIEPVRYLIVQSDIVAPSTLGNFRFEYDNTATFTPLGVDVIPDEDKTLYDFVNGVMQVFNLVIDNLRIQDQGGLFIEGLALRRFDDIRIEGDVIDWSGKIDAKIKPKFKPKIDGYTQNSYIKFKEIFTDGGDYISSRKLTCLNKNLDVRNDLFDIDAYTPGIYSSETGQNLILLKEKESFKTFPFLYVDVSDVPPVDFVFVEYTNQSITINTLLSIAYAEKYSLDGEYQLLDTLLDYPVFYEASMWLKMSDLKDLKFFRQYFIQELGGSFFINKISGFNPEKSFASTKIELIKVSNDTPYLNGDTNVWVDGVDDPWTDGIGDVFV